MRWTAPVTGVALTIVLVLALGTPGVEDRMGSAEASPARISIEVLGEPILGADHLYVVGEDAAAAIDRMSGERIWTEWEYGDDVIQLTSGPWSVDGRILAADRDGDIVRISKDNGSVDQTGLGVDGRPVSGTGTPRGVAVIDDSYRVSSLDLGASEVRWTVNLSQPGSDVFDFARYDEDRRPRTYLPFVEIGPDHDRVVVGMGRKMVALELETGALAWNRTFPFPPRPPAIVEDGDPLIVTAANETVHGLSSRGSARWSTSLSHRAVVHPTADGNRTFVGTDDGSIHGLSTSAGRVAWSHPLPESPGFLTGPMDASERCRGRDCPGQVVAAGTSHGLQGIEVASSVIWMDESVTSPQSLDAWSLQERLYLVHRGLLVAVDPATGEPDWEAEVSHVVGFPPDQGPAVDLETVGILGLLLGLGILGAVTLTLFPPEGWD